MSNAAKQNFIFIFILSLNAISLFPLLLSGYFADDILNSAILGEALNTGRSIYEVSIFYAKQWFYINGRVFPLAFLYSYNVFYYFDTLFSYKLFVLCVVLTSVILYYRVIYKLTDNNKLANITCLLLPLLYQFRYGNDPILAYNAVYPFLTVLLFSSILLSLHKSTLCKLTSYILYLCACLFFEVMYPFFIVYFISFYIKTKRLKLSIFKSLPYFAIAVFLAIFSFYSRSILTTEIATTYQINFDFISIIKGYINQVLGSIPFIYSALDPHKLFNFSDHIKFIPIFLSGIALFCAVIFSIATLVNNTSNQKPILLFGISLFLLPATLISLSSKFQAMLLGDAYLPVYITYFGVSLIFSLFINAFIEKKSNNAFLQFCLLLLFSLLFIFNTYNNYNVVSIQNKNIWEPRKLLHKAINAGLMKNIPEDAIILIDKRYHWNNKNEYSSLLKQKMLTSYFDKNLLNENSFLFSLNYCQYINSTTKCYFEKNKQVYLIGINYSDVNKGNVILTKVIGASINLDKTISLNTTKSIAYIHRLNKGKNNRIVFSVIQNDTKRPVIYDDNNFDHITSGVDWDLIELKKVINIKTISLDTIKTYDATLTDLIEFKTLGIPSFLRMITGISGTESWGRWSDSAEVNFHLLNPLPTQLTLHFSGNTFGSNAGKMLKVNIGNEIKEIKLKQGKNKYTLHFKNIKKHTRNMIFTIPQPISPFELGVSADKRKLGFGFETLKIDI